MKKVCVTLEVNVEVPDYIQADTVPSSLKVTSDWVPAKIVNIEVTDWWNET